MTVPKVERNAWASLFVWLVLGGVYLPAAAQDTWNCVWISVTLGAKPERIGWNLVSTASSDPELILGGGMPVGGYTKELIAAYGNRQQFCHEVRVSTALGTSGFALRLISDNNKPWNDRSAIVSITDRNCQNIQFEGVVPIEAYKDTAEPVTIKYLPPLAFLNCGEPLLRISAEPALPPGVVPNAGTVKCPSPPVLSTARSLGPDLVPVMTPAFQKLTIQRECWSTKKVIKWNPKDPWNEKWQSYCEAVESNIPEGCHLTMRFRAGIANIGTTDLYLGSPYDQFLAGNPMWVWADCHRHWHWRGFATYQLVDVLTGKVYDSKKTGYCAEDTKDIPKEYPLGVYNGVQASVSWQGKAKRFNRCGTANKTACQGISVGKMDTYEADLAGQFFCLVGCPGGNIPLDREYYIRITANPAYPRTPGRPCPYTDSKGLCHTLFELNYFNNMGQFKIKLTRDMVPSKYRYMVPPTPAPVPLPKPAPVPKSPPPKAVPSPIPAPLPVVPAPVPVVPAPLPVVPAPLPVVPAPLPVVPAPLPVVPAPLPVVPEPVPEPVPVPVPEPVPSPSFSFSSFGRKKA